MRTDDLSWQEHAVCVDADPDLFIPPFNETKAQLVVRNRKALSYCARCPDATAEACLQYALARGEDGIWGRTTGRQRRAMRSAQLTAGQ